MKKILLFSTAILLLGGCDKINEFKLNYQAKNCGMVASIGCTDILIQQAILSTKQFRQEFLDDKQKTIAELGETHYHKLLELLDQKIKHLEDQRPSLFNRWFKGSETYYPDVDYGESIDTKIINLLHENDFKNQSNNSSEQASVQTTPLEAINLTEGEPIETAQISKETPEKVGDYPNVPSPTRANDKTYEITQLVQENGKQALQEYLDETIPGMYKASQVSNIKFIRYDSHAGSYNYTWNIRIKDTETGNTLGCNNVQMQYSTDLNMIVAAPPEECFQPIQ